MSQYVPPAEPEAVDLLLEVEQLQQLEAHVDDRNYARTCLYLVSCCTYLPGPEDMQVTWGRWWEQQQQQERPQQRVQ